MKILMLHGINHDMFGKRDPKQYGTITLDQINEQLIALGRELGVEVAQPGRRLLERGRGGRCGRLPGELGGRGGVLLPLELRDGGLDPLEFGVRRRRVLLGGEHLRPARIGVGARGARDPEREQERRGEHGAGERGKTSAHDHSFPIHHIHPIRHMLGREHHEAKGSLSLLAEWRVLRNR